MDITQVLILMELGTIPLVIFAIVWRRLGGWPEAYYRIKRISYFTQKVIMADGSVTRFVHKMRIIRHQSPPSFDFSGRTWSVDAENQLRDNGRPSWVYNHDDLRPVPVLNWGEGKAHIDSKISPGLVFNAFHDKAIEEMHGLGQPKPKNIGLLLLVLIGIGILIAGVGLYYQYNVFCGLNPARC